MGYHTLRPTAPSFHFAGDRPVNDGPLWLGSLVGGLTSMIWKVLRMGVSSHGKPAPEGLGVVSQARWAPGGRVALLGFEGSNKVRTGGGRQGRRRGSNLVEDNVLVWGSGGAGRGGL